MKHLFLFLVIVLVCFISSLPTVHAKKQYGIMIDAGSSGTRCFLYSWDYRKAPASSHHGPFSFPITQEGWSLKSPRRLADYGKNPDLVNEIFDPFNDYIVGLLNNLKEPSDDHALAQIPVYLGATAGMRLIPRKERTDIIQATRKYFHKSKFAFEDSYAKIISGDEEGVFGFIAANYLKNTLVPPSHIDPKRKDEDKDYITYGSLDMGGASTQITFVPKEDIMENFFDYMTPSGYRHQLYTVSFLEFGLNEFVRSVNDHFSAGIVTPGTVVENACLNQGRVQKYTNISTGIEVEFHGTGLIEDCLPVITKLLLLDARCLTDKCSINGVYQPSLPDNMVFLTYSGFNNFISTYTEKTTPLHSIQDIEKMAEKVCGMTAEDLQKAYPKVPEQFLFMACTALSYYTRLLDKAYGFPLDKPLFHVGRDIDGTEISWALGRMVYEVNLLQYDRIMSNNTINTGLFVTTILLCAIVIFCAFMVYRYNRQIRKYENDNNTIIGEPHDVNHGEYKALT